MSFDKPTRITYKERSRLRSELLGSHYVYDVMESLTNILPRSRLEIIADLFESYGPAEEWSTVVEDVLEVLSLIGALQSATMRLSPPGREWYEILQELNTNLGKPFEIIQDDLPGFFFERCLAPYLGALDEVIIVSPWISGFETGSRFARICEALKEQGARLVVISRRPDKAWHRDSLAILRAKGGARVYINEGLHAKLYISKSSDRIKSRAIIGSANLTKPARFDNVEIGLLVRGITDRYYRLIEDLITSSRDLKLQDWKEAT